MSTAEVVNVSRTEFDLKVSTDAMVTAANSGLYSEERLRSIVASLQLDGPKSKHWGRFEFVDSRLYRCEGFMV